MNTAAYIGGVLLSSLLTERRRASSLALFCVVLVPGWNKRGTCRVSPLRSERSTMEVPRHIDNGFVGVHASVYRRAELLGQFQL